MDRQDLLSLVTQIHNGRTEDQNVDWKRQWPKFKEHDKAKEEFRKDIAALANSCGEGPAHLIYGLKEGKFYDSPLPQDEAEIQDILRKITPIPKVHLSVIALEDAGEKKTVCAVEILPPYDRPYVTQINKHNVVPIRIGSSTSTATRFDLDALYKAPSRFPRLEVAWEYWPSRRLPSGRGKRAEVLPVPRPLITLKDLDEELRDNIRVYEERWGPLPETQVEEFKEQAETFLRSLEETENLAYWYSQRTNVFFDGVPFSLIMSNTVTQVATGPKVKIRFPPWLFPTTGKELKRPETMCRSRSSLPLPPSSKIKEHGHRASQALDASTSCSQATCLPLPWRGESRPMAPG